MRGDQSIRRSAGPLGGTSPVSRLVSASLALAIAFGGPASQVLAAPILRPGPSSANEPQARASVAIEQIFPAGTLFAASMPDFRKSSEAFKGTALYDIWMEPQLQKFLEKPLQMLNAVPAMMQQQMAKMPGGGKGLELDQLQTLLGGELAFGLTSLTIPPNVSDQNPPDVGFVVVAKLGNEKAFDSVLDAIESLAKSEQPDFVREKVDIGGVAADSFGTKSEPFRLYSSKSNGYAVISFSKNALASTVAAISGKAPAAGATLASDPNFSAVAKDARSQAEVGFVFVNVEAILKAIDPVAPPPVKNVIAASGISGLKSLAFSASFEGKGFADVAVAYAPGEPKGLLKASPSQPIDLKLLDMIPQDVTTFTIGQFDLGAVWTTAWDMVRAVDAAKEGEVKGMLGQFESQVGVKIKDDVIDSLGTRMIFYQRAAQPGQMFPDMAFFMQIKSQDRLRDAMGKLTKLAPQGVALKEVKIAENTYYYVDLSAVAPIPFFQPSYAFADDYLIVALNLQSLKSIVNARKSASFASVRQNEEFKSLLPKIPQNVTSLSYTDQKRSFGTAYDSVKQMIPLLLMSVGTELPIDVALLPTSDTFTRHLYGSYGYSVTTPTGSRSISVGPFSVLVLLPILAVAGAAAGLMVSRQEMAHQASAVDKEAPGEEGDEAGDPEDHDKKADKEPRDQRAATLVPDRIAAFC